MTYQLDVAQPATRRAAPMKPERALAELGIQVRPTGPQPWEADVDPTAFAALVGALLARGGEAPEIWLSAVTVDAEAAGDRMLDGEFVAFSVRGGEWGPETTWRPADGDPRGGLAGLEPLLAAAGAALAYTRAGASGSITVFLPRCCDANPTDHS